MRDTVNNISVALSTPNLHRSAIYGLTWICLTPLMKFENMKFTGQISPTPQVMYIIYFVYVIHLNSINKVLAKIVSLFGNMRISTLTNLKHQAMNNLNMLPLGISLSSTLCSYHDVREQ